MACPENIQIMADNSDKQSWLLNYLSKPLWLDSANAALRVTFPSAQAVTVSSGTVTTVTNMAQKGSIALADTELRWEMANLWHNSARRGIT